MVVPELRLPGLLVRHDIAASDNPRQALLDLVEADHQFAALDLPSAEIEQCVDRLQGDHRADAFLREIAELLANRRQSWFDKETYRLLNRYIHLAKPVDQYALEETV